MDVEPWKALRQIFSGEVTTIDVGEIRDEFNRREFFNNTIGIGFDAIVTIYSHQMPIVRGFLMYFAAVMKTIFLNHTPMNMLVSIDGQSDWQDSLLMLTLCNGGREGGGFMIYPEAEIGDGQFHFVSVPNVSRLMMLRLLPAFMKGTHLSHPKIKSGSFSSIQIASDLPLYIHTDGEIFSGFTSNLKQISVDIHPGALRIIS
jgi:diacylglycerol kinase family enzyme